MPDPQEAVEELLEKEVDDDVAKALEGEETPSDSTTEKESSSKDDSSSRADTSLKTEEEESEDKSEKNEEEKVEDEDDTRFDKHPRWKKINEERETALEERDRVIEEVKSLRELKTKLEGFDPDELGRLKEVGKLLKSNPELAKKVQEVIDGHDFRNSEVKGEISKISSELQRIEQERVLDKYDNRVKSLLSEHKVSEDLSPIVSELLETRVIKKNIPYNGIEKEFKDILRQINTFNRKNLASHVETKKSESKVPASPTTRDKVITSKKESAEMTDIIGELAEGLKSSKE